MLIFGAPFRYYQGWGILDTMGEVLAPMGKKFLLVGDAFVFEHFGERLDKTFSSAGLVSVRGLFNGESSDSEIRRLGSVFAEEQCTAVVGVGGGKAADTAKAVSILHNAPVAIVPTIAASDAPVSHIAMIYNDDHSKKRVDHMRYSPWCIFMDTEIILNAPLRLFISGIGDAVATKFEADACRASGARNYLQGRQPQTAAALCDLCWDIVRRKSLEAIAAVKTGTHNEAFEEVVEATTLLSGLGFENGGLAAGHAMSSGLTMIPSSHGSTHGETVAFGILTQFMLEKRSQAFIADMLDFFRAVGLPTTLRQIGVSLPAERPHVRAMVEKICTPPNIVFNMPCEITPDILENAVYAADALGQ
ncbi:MAG: glycerol dehydrogenase [Deltaproteobacteria bacterium]|jgi:glycerol dehydrogenase|nr:glycerol dehydrogenase [Deltaproteobacteria bacterium]